MRCWTLPVEMNIESVSSRWNARISDHNTDVPKRVLMVQFVAREPAATRLSSFVHPSFALHLI